MTSLLLLLVLPALALSATPKCPSPPSFSSHFTLTHRLPFAAVPRARRYLSAPHVFRLLFADSVVRVRALNRTHYRLLDIHAHPLVVSLHRRGPAAHLRFAAHHPRCFPVPLHSASLDLSLLPRARFRIAFRAPHINRPRPRRARNLYARARVEQMLAHVHAVLGSRRCSATLPHISALCNNLRFPHYGMARVPQLAHPKRGKLTLRHRLPNPRLVSNALCKDVSHAHAPRRLNFLMVVFGQFLDHDIVLTPSGEHQKRHAPFSALNKRTARQRMSFLRSDILALPKCCDKDYAIVTTKHKGTSPFNQITAFVDASGIYGSTPLRMRALRSFKHGKLIMSRYKGHLLLPRNSKRHLFYTLDNANRPNDPALFAAGDVRANENPVLTSLHTIFVREHNRVCNLLVAALSDQNKPLQTDEWLFQQARKVVMAELQNIVYNEFLPAVLGESALPEYTGYDPKVDATMNLLFTTAAYRWGHSAVRNDLLVRDFYGRTYKEPFQNAFFNTKLFETVGVEKWLLGAMHSRAMDVDLEHVDSIRDFLFSPKKRGTLDLVALNIQRGRDHELPSYLAARKLYGLSGGLEDIPKNLQERILAVYRKPHHIDAFVGGLAERKVHESLLGPLLHKIVVDQFLRLRDGDRFFYSNMKWGKFMSGLDIVKQIQMHEVRLADVIQLNTRIKESHMPSKDGAMKVAA